MSPAFLLLALFVVSVHLTLPDSVARAAEGIVHLRSLPTSMNFPGHLDIDQGARRLFEIGDSPSGGMAVSSFDLDGFSPTGSVAIPGSASGFGGKLSVVDEVDHRLYVLYPEGLTNSPKTVLSIAVIDTTNNAVLATKVIADAPAAPSDRSSSNDLGIKAISFYRPPDGSGPKIYLVSEVPTGMGDFSASNHSVVVTEVEVAKLGTSDPGAVNWRFQLPQCAMSMARETPSVVYRTKDGRSIFVPCRAGGMPGLFSQPMETPGIVEIEVNPGASPADTSRFASDFFPISGNLQWGLASIDSQAERMYIHVDGSTTESAVWAFDMGRTSWLGASVLPAGYASGSTSGLGVDRTLGRLYATSSVKTDPVPHIKVVAGSTRSGGAEQGRILIVPTDANVGRGKMLVDSLRHRFFLTTGEGFAVYEDRTESDVVPDVSDPDANTTDLVEGAGTSVNFSGGGQAYATRVRWVRGIRGVERNSNTIVDNLPYPSEPAQGTRDIHLARVIGVTLNNGEATAKATAGDRDRESTDNDLVWATTEIKDLTGIDQTQQRWPYQTVECTDFGGAGDKISDSDNGGYVSCKRESAEASGLAYAQAIEAIQDVKFGYSWARVRLVRDPARGVVSVSEAEVKSLDIAGKAGIGRIFSKSETWAAGRPGTAGSNNFQRVIQDVWFIDTNGERKQLCGEFCDPQLVRVTLNRALGVKARVDLPVPDPQGLKGTPKGYEALVVRDQYEKANERSVNEEADEKRLEVPALVLTFFADGRSPSRVVYSFAATAAESHYGIYKLSEEDLSFLPDAISQAAEDLDGVLSGETSTKGPIKQAGNAVATMVKKTFAGLKFFLASPGHAARAGALWLFLAAPLLLWMRRGALAG